MTCARLALVTFCALAVASCARQTPITNDGASSESEAATVAGALPTSITVNRYVIFHSPHIEKDTMLLDTATGRTWVLSQDGPDGPLSWERVHRPTVDDAF